MRILMLGYDYPPSGSGAAHATASLAEALAREGAAVDVVASGVQPVSHATLGGAAEGAVLVHRLPIARRADGELGVRGTAGYITSAMPLMRRLLRERPYDAVHVAFALPGAGLLRLFDLGGAAVILSLRGEDVPAAGEPLLRPVVRWLWRRADRLVVPSERVGRSVTRIDPALRYTVVPGGVDPTSFRPRGALRRVPDGVVRCLAVARLVPHNGLDDLLDAIALLDRRRFQLEIVGAGPHEAALRARVRRLGLESRVRLAGWLERNQLARRYREADLFTLAPRRESLGGSFLEALASGLPVVGSTAGDLPEILGHGRHGVLVPPARPHELAQAIDRLADDPPRRAEMSRRNRAEAVEKYAWPRLASRYLALYHSAGRSARDRSAAAELPAGSW